MDQYYDSTGFGAARYEESQRRFHWPLVELGVALWNGIDPPSPDASPEVLTASATHALRLIRYQTAKLLFYGGLAMGLAGVFLLLAFRGRVRATFDADRSLFLALWILPAALFFALNHLGAWGYLLLFLAALAIIAAQAIVVLFPTPRGQAVVTGTLVLTNVLLFLCLRPLPDTTERNRLLNIALLQYGAPSIRAHYARARSSAFSNDPRQLARDCVTDECLEKSIKKDFALPAEMEPVRPFVD